MSAATEIRRKLELLGCKVEPCGSRVTCDPAPVGSDEDYLVEVVSPSHQGVSQIVSLVSGVGFKWEGDEHYQNAAANDFMSWRKGDINLIVTASSDFARRHRSATVVCKRLNLLRKPDRVAVFQAVLYGNAWVEKTPLPAVEAV